MIIGCIDSIKIGRTNAVSCYAAEPFHWWKCTLI